MILRLQRQAFDLSKRALLVGVLNVTPDSFSDGGKYLDPAAAAERARYLAAQGADVIDVGGESTRPGAGPVGEEEELSRVLPAIAAIRKAGIGLPLSVDTQKARVACEALCAGADMLNDVSGGLPGRAALEAAVERGAAVVLMHNRGTSKDMYAKAEYKNVVEEVRAELADLYEKTLKAGVREDAIVLDPGIGFAKRAADSWALLDGLSRIVSLGRPVMVGASRKSFLKDVFGAELERGTQAASVVALLRGARLLRVHEPGLLRDVSFCRAGRRGRAAVSLSEEAPAR